MKRGQGLILFIAGLCIGWLANNAVEFLRIDTCLDDGSAWNYQAEACQQP